MLSKDEILKIFYDCGALLEGHFLLTSGLHSPKYLQCALVLQYPKYASELCSQLAYDFQGEEIELVISPAIGGIIVTHEVAKALGVRALFAEREAGKMTLRRGFQIQPGERALVVEDVITTGGSTREVMDVVTQHGGIVAGVGSLVDRSAGKAIFPMKKASLLTLEIPTYQPQDCPLCQGGSQPIKPGSRGL
ncbi:MAG: orotate phosphoribosyltransferase [candidate division NC10 bacterium]|nr:orotate phosphoribosyltransferase [candidate division NC10 bacterium]